MGQNGLALKLKMPVKRLWEQEKDGEESKTNAEKKPKDLLAKNRGSKAILRNYSGK